MDAQQIISELQALAKRYQPSVTPEPLVDDFTAHRIAAVLGMALNHGYRHIAYSAKKSDDIDANRYAIYSILMGTTIVTGNQLSLAMGKAILERWEHYSVSFTCNEKCKEEALLLVDEWLKQKGQGVLL